MRGAIITQASMASNAPANSRKSYSGTRPPICHQPIAWQSSTIRAIISSGQLVAISRRARASISTASPSRSFAAPIMAYQSCWFSELETILGRTNVMLRGCHETRCRKVSEAFR